MTKLITSRRRERAILLGLTILVLVPVYASTASWDLLQSNDPRSAAQAGWTLVATGDLAFDRRWEASPISWPAEGRDGRLYSNRFPGVIGLASAAYLFPVMTGLVPRGPLDHPHDVPIWPATLMAVLVAALAAALTYLLFRETDVPWGMAAVGAGIVALGSPLWSVSADALWTHGATHALLVGILLAVVKERALLAGVLAVATVTFRPHLVVPLLIVAMAQPTWRGRLSLSVGGGVGLGLVALYSWWLFGQPLPAAGYAVEHLLDGPPITSATGMAANVSDWLVNPDRSVLIFVPAVLLALPRIGAAWRSSPRWVRTAALGGVGYAVAQLGLIRASGGTFFFGHRTTVEALVLAAPLLLLSVHRLFLWGAAGRVAVTATLAFSVATHAFGAWIGMPRDAEESLREQDERRGAATITRSHEPRSVQNVKEGRTIPDASERRAESVQARPSD